jgi:hypothetical protein
MKMDFSGIKVENEEQFMQIVHQLNHEIEFCNITKPKTEQEPLLDAVYLLNRYRKMKRQEKKKAFRERYDCEYCLYDERPRRCHTTPERGCPLENGKHIKEVEKMPTCCKDQEGDCPYGNEVGTCFGLCYQQILSDFYKERKNR